ncbi:helix-turn-helix domain-containing protein [Flectobacillus roseus]|uniref:helix-turn-helix domain-containing protein n=1 Tax=Flectobacillus roseus TaxID=502259 RepID=UPI0024B7898D|nr:AraC family transcriptional regulator [Flectobacillus roseus]MDI9871174.1 AraC family transcriptional regulator [Flectobacillus roseus]
MPNQNPLILALKAKKSNVEIHKHAAFQIVFTDDYPFSTTLESQEYPDIFGFVIKPQVAHACVCNQGNVVILNIEPYSILGKLIEEQLGDKNAIILYTKVELQHFLGMQEGDFSLDRLLDLNLQNSLIQPLDTRIEDAITFIHEHFKVENISTQEVANHVFLSPSRLATLFKQQIGSSISKYLLWTRLRNAIFQILTAKDKNLTTIALESGFYDSSQMTKYMYQLFGISPSKLKQKSDLIQFLAIETT